MHSGFSVGAHTHAAGIGPSICKPCGRLTPVVITSGAQRTTHTPATSPFRPYALHLPVDEFLNIVCFLHLLIQEYCVWFTYIIAGHSIRFFGVSSFNCISTVARKIAISWLIIRNTARMFELCSRFVEKKRKKNRIRPVIRCAADTYVLHVKSFIQRR